MRVLSFSSCFPSTANPSNGIFVYHRLGALSEYVHIEVVHPIPWFPFYTNSTGRPENARREFRGLTIHEKTYFYIPRVLKRIDGWLYYQGLVDWMERYIESAGKPDLLDAHFMWPDGVGVSHLAQRFDIPFTITLRGTINPRIATSCFRRRMAGALRNASAVISLSEPMGKIAEQLGAPRESIHVIPNGVDGDLFVPLPRCEARLLLGLREDGFLILCVANLKGPKGHRELIEALSRLSEDVQLICIGSQTDHGAYLLSLKQLVQRMGLTGRVRFQDHVPQSRIVLYYNAADLSVLGSRSEGCPNVVLESLACGTPVVATSVGAIPDIIRSGENGFLTPVADPASLAAAIERALGTSFSRQGIRRTCNGLRQKLRCRYCVDPLSRCEIE